MRQGKTQDQGTLVQARNVRRAMTLPNLSISTFTSALILSKPSAMDQITL
jgi:hypothetical protein